MKRILIWLVNNIATEESKGLRLLRKITTIRKLSPLIRAGFARVGRRLKLYGNQIEVGESRINLFSFIYQWIITDPFWWLNYMRSSFLLWCVHQTQQSSIFLLIQLWVSSHLLATNWLLIWRMMIHCSNHKYLFITAISWLMVLRKDKLTIFTQEMKTKLWMTRWTIYPQFSQDLEKIKRSLISHHFWEKSQEDGAWRIRFSKITVLIMMYSSRNVLHSISKAQKSLD